MNQRRKLEMCTDNAQRKVGKYTGTFLGKLWVHCMANAFAAREKLKQQKNLSRKIAQTETQSAMLRRKNFVAAKITGAGTRNTEAEKMS